GFARMGFFFQAEDGIRYRNVTGVQTCALPISDETEKVDDSADVSEEQAEIEVGEEAPDFELETLDGETTKLSDLKGKKVILNFWATWCPPCQKEMPEMQEF